MKRALTLIAAASSIAIATAANAQARRFTVERGSPSIALGSSASAGPDLRSSPITPSEFETYIKILGLDEDLASVARDMYEGFRTENAEITTAFREQMADLVAEIQKTNDHQMLMEKMPELNQQRTERSETLRDTFLEDLKLLLTDEQAQRWPLLEQNRRRTRVQSQLNVSGAGVDLIALTENTLDAVPAPAREKLETYARDLDRMLLDVIALREKRSKELDLNVMGNPEQQEELRELSNKQRELSVSVRDLNDRTLRLLASELTNADADALTHAFKLAAFPRVYTPSYTDNSLAAALNMGSLEPEQRDRVSALASGHTAAAAKLNERWERAIRENDEDPGAGMFFSGPGGATVEVRIDDGDFDEADESDLEKASAARNEHDEKILARLQSLLNDTQLAALPPKPKEIDPFDPANLPEGANAVFISTIESDDGQTTTDIQVLTPAGNANEQEVNNDSKN